MKTANTETFKVINDIWKATNIDPSEKRELRTRILHYYLLHQTLKIDQLKNINFVSQNFKQCSYRKPEFF